MITKRRLQLQINALERAFLTKLDSHTHHAADIVASGGTFIHQEQRLPEVIGGLITRLASLEELLNVKYHRNTPPHHVRSPKKK